MAHPCLWVGYGVHQRHSVFSPVVSFVPCVHLLACVEGTCGLGERFTNALPRHMRWQVLFSTRLVILVCLAVSFRRGDLECGLVGWW